MNSKKKTPAAQQLIDSLLDELPLVSKQKPVKGGAASSSSRSSIDRGPRELVFTLDTEVSGEVILDDGQRITIRSEVQNEGKSTRDHKQVPNSRVNSGPAGNAGMKGAGVRSPAVPSNAPSGVDPKLGNRFPPQKPKESESEILAHFEKNVGEMSDDSVIFTGELGTEGTNTMLEQAGKRAKEKLDPNEDLGDPLFQKTKSMQIGVGTSSASSGAPSNSLHIHSVKNLENELGPAVDLLVEALELTNPAFKKPERVLPRAESTPRRDIKDAPQVEEFERSDESVRMQKASIDLDLTTVTKNNGGFDAPYTNEINLNLETNSLNDEEAGLPAIPEFKKVNAMPLNQHELSFPSEELAVEALDAVADEMLTHHTGLIGEKNIPVHASASHSSHSDPMDITRSLAFDEPKASLESPAPQVSKDQLSPQASKDHPSAAQASQDQPSPQVSQDQPSRPAQTVVRPSTSEEPRLLANEVAKVHGKRVSEQMAALPKLGALKKSNASPANSIQSSVAPAALIPETKKVSGSPIHAKEISILENGRGVLDRVLAKVRGSGLEKGINFKDAIVKKIDDRLEGKEASRDKGSSRNKGSSKAAARDLGGDDESHQDPDARFKQLVDAPVDDLASLLANERPQNQSEDLNENTLPVIQSEPSQVNTRSASVLQFPKTSSSGMRWTENSVQSDLRSLAYDQKAQAGAGHDRDEHTLPPIEASKQGPLDTMDRMMNTEIRPGAARLREQQDEFINQGKENPRQGKAGGGVGYGIPSFHSAEASLKQSESLRIAQTRISDLEQELERLRRENEKLASAGETLRRHSDELRARAENAEQERSESERIRDEERKVMRGQMSQKDRENIESRQRLEEAEGRLESNFKKIRVRERELEHRLEIMKMESATLVSTKDKMILELKRQLDQLTHENEYGKQKAQEAFSQYKAKQETARRVVRALRIALTILEGDDENVVPHKKAE